MVEQLSTPRFWVPGWRQAIVFVTLFFAGLLAWGMGASVSGDVSGDAPFLAVPFEERPFTYAFPFYLGFNLYMIFAFLAGFLFPRCFYLWGAALLFAYPIAEVLRFVRLEAATDFNVVVPDGTFGWISVAFGSIVFAVFYGSVATGLSTIGAGLRWVAHRLRTGEW